MRYSVFTSVLAAGLAIAHPAEKRQVAQDYNAPPGGDVTILNYALTLEYLERKFYQEGLQKFSRADFVGAGFADPFCDNLKVIAGDEEALPKLLSTKDILQLLAQSLPSSPATAHTFAQPALKQVPFPKAFDTPLDFNQVFSLAAQFITGFVKGDPALPFKAFPALTLEASRYAYTTGSSPVTFSGAYKKALASKLITEGQKVYAVFFSGLDTYYVETYETRGDGGDLKVKAIASSDKSENLSPPTGQVYVVLSTADGVNSKVKDANTISGVGVLEVLPPRN